MIQANEISKTSEAVKNTPYSYIRLTDPKGTTLVGAKKMDREKWIQENLIPYLKNEPKSSYYLLSGREQSGKYNVITEIETGMKKPSAEPIKTISSKAEANFDLLQENSKLLSRCQILEYQNEELLKLISEQEKTIEELEKTIDELEAEEQPTLSEQQNLLVDFAKPLLPGLQAFAINFLSQYLPQQPNLTDDQRGTQNAGI